ncbi:MAG: glycerophosphoryl diester phosphodiesterase [Planctomycetota bacterium]
MDPYEGLGDAGASGAHVPGPPWILGHRGTPREAPENTLAGLRRALELRLDGVEYDLRACATGEAVLLHDEGLERTTDARGPLHHRSLPELFGVDAGSWFSRRFTGETVPLLDEALDVAGGSESGGMLMHMIELKERGLMEAVSAALAERGLGPGARPNRGGLQVRVASFMRDVVLEARDAGLPSMLLARRACEDDRRFTRDERVTAMGLGPDGWQGEALEQDWGRVERWAWSVDEPRDLLEACRAGLTGFNTNEPHRALAVRALVHLAPDDDGPYPLDVPVLEVEPEALAEGTRARGEWYGSWSLSAEVRNPFPFPVETRCATFVRSGAFDVEGLPKFFELEPGETRQVHFELTGGARMPGADPLFACLYRWDSGTAGGAELQGAGQLLLDAPLRRERVTVADGLARRLVLLKEGRHSAQASLTLRRDRTHLLLSIENPGGLTDAHLIAALDGQVVRGGTGLRLRLPEAFDQTPRGLPFTCGIEGQSEDGPQLLRWAGGLPGGIGHGMPGRVISLGRG